MTTHQPPPSQHTVVSPRFQRHPTVTFPWLSALVHADGVAVAGDLSARRGHRLDRGDGNVDGIYADWRWDGHQLEAHTDHYGISPIYYAGDGDGVSISTSPIRLIEQGVSAELDHGALALLFRIGRLIGDQTPFAQIRLLPPGGTLRWRPGELTVEARPWQPPATAHIGRDAGTSTFKELFAAAINRRLPLEGQRAAVPLSGGRDSRQILLELVEQGAPPDLVMTHGYLPARPNGDLAVARDISARLGLPHLIVGEPAGNAEPLTLYNVLTNLSAPVPAPFLTSDLLAFSGERVDVAYEGLGGGTITNPDPFDGDPRVNDALLAGDFDQATDLLFELWGPTEDSLARILPGSMNRERASATLRPVLEASAQAPNPQMWFHFWSRTRRRISPGHLVLTHAVPTVFVPFLDHDLFEFLMSLPASFHDGGGFHDDLIARAYPQFADLDYARPARGMREPRLRGTARLGAFALRRSPRSTVRLGKWLSGRARGVRKSANVESLHYLTQLEALSRRGEADRQLRLADQLSEQFGHRIGTMLGANDPLPAAPGGHR